MKKDIVSGGERRETHSFLFSYGRIVGPTITEEGADIMNPRLSMKNIMGFIFDYQSIIKQYLRYSMISMSNNIHNIQW